MSTKDTKKLHSLVNQVLSFEVSKGHLKWKVSDLSRVTGISRPLIYYYLGNTKKLILEAAIDLMTSEFYGFNRDLTQKMTPELFTERLVNAQKLISEIPNLTVFYLKCRASSSPLQKKFIEIEKQYQSILSHYFPSLEKEKATALHGLIHGLITSPFANEKSVRASAKMLLAIIQKEN